MNITIPKDLIQHAGLGVVYVAAGLAHSYVSAEWGWGAAAAFDAAVGGVAYEANQWARKEGEVSVADALASALPGAAVWGVAAVPGVATLVGWLA